MLSTCNIRKRTGMRRSSMSRIIPLCFTLSVEIMKINKGMMQRIAIAYLKAAIAITTVVLGISLGDFLWDALGWRVSIVIGGISIVALIFYLIDNKKK